MAVSSDTAFLVPLWIAVVWALLAFLSDSLYIRSLSVLTPTLFPSINPLVLIPDVRPTLISNDSTPTTNCAAARLCSLTYRDERVYLRAYYFHVGILQYKTWGFFHLNHHKKEKSQSITTKANDGTTQGKRPTYSRQCSPGLVHRSSQLSRICPIPTLKEVSLEATTFGLIKTSVEQLSYGVKGGRGYLVWNVEW